MKRKKNQTPSDTSEFDKEFVADRFKPLSRADRARWKRVQKKRRPKTDKNGRAETVPVEAGLLDQLDSLAKKMGTTRESLVVRGIKAVLAAAGKI